VTRRKRHEEQENHEAWAIPYGDLVTLLLAFFVVMYAMSSVNEGKYRVLSDSLNEAFHGAPHSTQSQAEPEQHPIQELPTTQVSRMMLSGMPARHVMQSQDQPNPDANASQGETKSASDPSSIADATGVELGRVVEDVDLAMSSLIASGQVHVHRHDNSVTIDISSDILFSSGAAQLQPKATGVLLQLANALKPFPNAIRVAGHTDNRPINTPAFPSNWELSTARAASVVHLFMDHGLLPQRMSVLGYGEYRPILPNSNDSGRNANRRVEVTILGRDAPADQ
jgi:chemotaxis protein MotB